MSLQFIPATLWHWDDLLDQSTTADALAMSFFSDERPLRGVAGLVDWRLCGRLSQLIMSSHCSGKRGDVLMMPAGRRLPFERIFLFGLGKGERMDEELFAAHAKWMHEVLHRAGVKSYALQAPGRATGLIGARRAAELWMRHSISPGEAVTLLDSPAVHKEIGDLLAA